MDAFATPLSYTVKNGSEILGYLVIDSSIDGRSCGGLRLVPDVDEAEIAGLARAMTLKFGYLSLPQGGAKAGVRGDPEAPLAVRRQRLAEFGRAIAPLLRDGRYAPFADMGTDNTDIRAMLEAAGVRVKQRELRGHASGYYTALSVLTGIKQGARHLGIDLGKASVAIEGYGKVGGALGELLAAERVRVVAISTSRGAIHNPRGLDLARVSRLVAAMGTRFVEAYEDAETIDRASLLELPVDVLCPCARHDTIHAGNAGRIAARLISPGANNPITPDAERILAERSIVSLPYFVSNCGGALGGTMEFAAHDRQAIASFIDRVIGGRMARLLARASQQGATLASLAERESRARFARLRQAAARATVKDRLFAAGLEAHRRGWVPTTLVRRLSLPYFERQAGESPDGEAG
jgi:glutamate dehydrogenase (NAD(P)+)